MCDRGKTPEGLTGEITRLRQTVARLHAGESERQEALGGALAIALAPAGTAVNARPPAERQT